MTASIVSVSDREVTIEVKVTLCDSMLESEEAIQNGLNEAGCLATTQALSRFDTDGSRIEIGDMKWFSKGQSPKSYQTPYGEIEVARHIYQHSKGGKTFCPLERDARIVVTSTPRFAKIVSHKFANGSSVQVKRDLGENHNRVVARSYLQGVADAVGTVVQAKEETWQYATPKLDEPVKAVAIGVDGTCMLMCNKEYREAMVGTISLYGADTARLHTIYIGATPEYGKATFFERMEREIAHVRSLYPKAEYVGIADGAHTNWDFLKKHTTTQVLDFYHAAEYLADVSKAAFPRSAAKRSQWLEDHCHDLKHKQGAATRMLNEMQAISNEQQRLAKPLREKLESAITYFTNHKHQMHYATYRRKDFPIGSGVTEAACKTLVKQRLCESGMKWVEKGASIVLSLRALVLTKERWQRFWSKIDQYGFPVAA